MARLRANAGRSAATLLARLPGLTIMRRQEQRLEPAGPEPERWRGWMLQIMVHGARSVTAGPRILAQGPGALLWSGPCPGALQVRYLPGVVADCLTLAWSDEGWRQFLARFPHFAARHRRQLDGQSRSPVLALAYAPPLLHAARQLARLSAARPFAPLAVENACATLLTLAAAVDFAGETREAAGWRAAGQTRYFEQAAALLLGRLGQAAPGGYPVAELAAELYLSPRQLQRIFLAQAGMSPLAYAQLLRLSEANLLLACTDESISGIAARLGYANAAHFSAAFRRAYRCAPRQIRERPDPAAAPAKEEPWQ